MKKILNDSDLENIKKLYLKDKLKIKEICDLYKISRPTIENFFKKHKIETRTRKDYHKYSINLDFFETINTEEKAYFLGLLYADGNIYKRSLRLSLQERDIDILNKIKKCINFSGDYYCSYSKSPNQQNRITLQVNSKDMVNDLIKLGCIPNKSFLLKFPSKDQVPNHLIRHFIRGYFDGDGWIYIVSKTNHFGIIGTKDLCENIKIILENVGIAFSNKALSLHKNQTNRILRLTSKKSILQVYKYLYENATIYIDRKYNKFQELLNK